MKPRWGWAVLICVLLLVGAGIGIYKTSEKENPPANLTAPAKIETLEQKAKENERLTNQIIADKVISDIIYIKDTRTRVIFAYNKSSGSIADVTGHGISSELLYLGSAEEKKVGGGE